MRNIVFYWATTTVLLCTGYVVYVRTLPPDELVMANTLAFQILVSLVGVGGPSLFVLFLLLLIGALLRRRRSSQALQGTRDEAARP